MTSMVRPIRVCREALLDMILSAIGCFMLSHCFRLIAAEREGMETTIPGIIGHAGDPLVYVGAALILLAVAAKESPELIGAGRM